MPSLTTLLTSVQLWCQTVAHHHVRHARSTHTLPIFSAPITRRLCKARDGRPPFALTAFGIADTARWVGEAPPRRARAGELHRAIPISLDGDQQSVTSMISSAGRLNGRGWAGQVFFLYDVWFDCGAPTPNLRPCKVTQPSHQGMAGAVDHSAWSTVPPPAGQTAVASAVPEDDARAHVEDAESEVLILIVSSCMDRTLPALAAVWIARCQHLLSHNLCVAQSVR